jgi:acetolactate synthase-1/2/3 large subunit
MTNPNVLLQGLYQSKKGNQREDLDAVAEMMASKDSYLLEVMVEK